MANILARIKSGDKILQFFRFRHTPSTMSVADEGPIHQLIAAKLKEKLEPKHLEIINESYMHNVPKGAETHFKVVVVSDQFKDVKLIRRHRLINEILANELQNGVHALSIVAKTVDQWGEGHSVEKSPACRGGFGK